jgi:hypothetical protein
MSNSSYIGRYLLSLGKIYLLVCPFFEPFFSGSIVKKRNFRNRLLLLTRAFFMLTFAFYVYNILFIRRYFICQQKLPILVHFLMEVSLIFKRNNAMASVSP